MIISGWGQYPKTEASIFNLEYESQLEFVKELALQERCIPRGMGRSYGDTALSNCCIDTTNYDYFINFDEESGLLTCTSGTTIKQIIDAFLPRGWFLSVTPGTQYVTIGGAIANDVHGKNHHIDGCFSETLESIEIFTLSKGTLHCSKSNNSALFHSTCGGLGLTGIIISATIQLKRIPGTSITETTLKTKDLEHTFDLFEQHEKSTYSVAWIDGMASGSKLGRSLISFGEHSEHPSLDTSTPKSSVPMNFPPQFLNKKTIQLFNFAYYNKQFSNQKSSTIPLRKFFFPLDRIKNWNRIYGARGFLQFQCVLPNETSFNGIKSMLEIISNRKSGSFLAVLKKMGKRNKNLMSFPIEGYTLAMDFPAHEENIQLVKTLNKITAENSGRVYLAKDSVLDKKLFERMYPKSRQFSSLKTLYSPTLESLLSSRLGI